MIVAAAQPFFAPFAGFFAKALLADVLVLYDSVPFPNRSCWLTRNRFKHEQGELWLTVPVRRRGRGPQRIREVEILREGAWAGKHLAGLRQACGRAPFFAEHLPAIERLVRDPPPRLAELNVSLIRHVAAALGCRARIALLSEIGVEAREPALSVEVARRLGASVFLAQRPAAKFLDPEGFAAAGVALRTFAYHPEPYPQLHGAFIANLSAFDLLFCCGPRAGGLLEEWTRPPCLP